MPTAFELLDNCPFVDYSRFLQCDQPPSMITIPSLVAQQNRASTSSMPAFHRLYADDVHPDDFGHVISLGPENMNDEQKRHFILNFYTPPKPPAHEWPAETRILNGKRIVRRLNPSFIDRDDCASMAYSPMFGGLFCRFCAIFPPESPQLANAAFVKKPFLRFSHMFGNGGAVKKHINRKYHREAEEKANILLKKKSGFATSFSA